jgi:hypothetical protein
VTATAGWTLYSHVVPTLQRDAAREIGAALLGSRFERTMCDDRSYAVCGSVAPNLPRARPMPNTLMKKPTKMPSGHKNPRVPAT